MDHIRRIVQSTNLGRSKSCQGLQGRTLLGQFEQHYKLLASYSSHKCNTLPEPKLVPIYLPTRRGMNIWVPCTQFACIKDWTWATGYKSATLSTTPPRCIWQVVVEGPSHSKSIVIYNLLMEGKASWPASVYQASLDLPQWTKLHSNSQ